MLGLYSSEEIKRRKNRIENEEIREKWDNNDETKKDMDTDAWDMKQSEDMFSTHLYALSLDSMRSRAESSCFRSSLLATSRAARHY